jgi:hypothetical protein
MTWEDDYEKWTSNDVERAYLKIILVRNSIIYLTNDSKNLCANSSWIIQKYKYEPLSLHYSARFPQFRNVKTGDIIGISLRSFVPKWQIIAEDVISQKIELFITTDVRTSSTTICNNVVPVIHYHI